MKDERETKQKLLASAKAEFLEKGYVSASLRNICKKAGVTTGALYFFFQDKEDLFASLVEEPLQKLYGFMVSHYQEEIDLSEQGQLKKDSYGQDAELAEFIIHYMYRYMEEMRLVLMKSQGSRYENYVNRFVEITEKHYRRIADQSCKMWKVPEISDEVIHWISHIQMDTFVYFITHSVPEEEAVQSMKKMMMFLISGWFGLFQPAI